MGYSQAFIFKGHFQILLPWPTVLASPGRAGRERKYVELKNKPAKSNN
jgi:hypothetical protein